MRITSVFMLALWVISCARAPIRAVGDAMRPARAPQMADDLDWSGFVKGLEAQIRVLKQMDQDVPMAFGPRLIPRRDYVRGLEYLLYEANADSTGERFRAALAARFESYEVYGQDHWGEVFITSYFEPVITGSLKPDKDFRTPLYARPADMVDVDLVSFFEPRPELAVLEKKSLEQRSSSIVLRGRLVKGKNGEDSRVVAYPARAGVYAGEIDSVAKPLAFVDMVDAFVLEIQGSGVVRLRDGKELKVGYAAQNGHPYVPIGKFLLDVIPKEKMSLFAIETHLRSLPGEEARRLMERNPSYVFFRPLQNGGITFVGNELFEGRTIATDQRYFPKGTLALLQFDKPQFYDEHATEPARWTPTSRFVFDQDTGGAIRGPGRVDLYAGRGSAAKQVAAVMKNKGHLYYFVPRPEAIAGFGK